MSYDPDRHHRRSIRLKGYDYSQAGAYFVNFCTQGRLCLFGNVVDGEMQLNAAGRAVDRQWQGLPDRFPFVELDEYVVMPNHVHGIIALAPDSAEGGEHKVRPYSDPLDGDNATGEGAATGRGEPCVRPNEDHPNGPHGTLPGTIGRIVQAFKSLTTDEYIQGVKDLGWPPFSRRIWQRGYYEHIIRGGDELERIRVYIAENPARWSSDPYHPLGTASGDGEFGLWS